MTNQVHKKVWYRPREVARLGLIQSSSGRNNEHGNYNFILSLIKAGRIKAKNYSEDDKRPYWIIHVDEIERFNREVS